MHVLIAGAGIGGLTTALCCVQHGLDVTVLERAPIIAEVGAGIQLPPNAMHVFRKLGLEDALRAVSVAPDAIETRMGMSGRTIFNIPLADHAEKKWGAPYLHIHRADYIAVLLDALKTRAPQALRLGQPVSHYEQNEDQVRIDGQATLTGDVLIGADGIQSVIRQQMLGEDAARFTGNVAWRATVPMDVLGDLAPKRTACAWMGEGRHAVTYQLRSGDLANFVGVVERDGWTEEGWTIKGSKAELMDDFAGWHPVITNLIQAVDEDQLYRWALFDRPPLTHWTDGRVALLGDSAHPMLPFLAQGAAMAVEDAWVLAKNLSRNRPPPMSLKAYADQRQARTAKVQSVSRANMGIFHKRGRVAQLATYGPMWLAGHVVPGIIHSRMNWLYGYDVTQSA